MSLANLIALSKIKPLDPEGREYRRKTDEDMRSSQCYADDYEG